MSTSANTRAWEINFWPSINSNWSNIDVFKVCLLFIQNICRRLIYESPRPLLGARAHICDVIPFMFEFGVHWIEVEWAAHHTAVVIEFVLTIKIWGHVAAPIVRLRVIDYYFLPCHCWIYPHVWFWWVSIYWIDDRVQFLFGDISCYWFIGKALVLHYLCWWFKLTVVLHLNLTQCRVTLGSIS